MHVCVAVLSTVRRHKSRENEAQTKVSLLLLLYCRLAEFMTYAFKLSRT